MTCEHNFCRGCWETYLTTKINEGDSKHILCPAFGCSILVPVDMIELLVSQEVARMYLKFDINNFVETNKMIKWCPGPTCERAVRLPDTELLRLEGKVEVSHSVDCGDGHFFCWECLGEAHAPVACSRYQAWLVRCARIDPEELHSSCQKYEDSASCQWLVSNSKPCPSCSSPIEKQDGCNHVKCTKCRHSFCWVCLEPWRKHSSSTGGYFRCNKYKGSRRQSAEQSKTGMEDQLLDINKFIHYYIRYKNHDNSRKVEEPLLRSVQHKRAVLQVLNLD
jgi:ankyrin repeat/IBR domain-containing protein 1